MAISIQKFEEQGGRLRTDDIDFDSFRDQPLSPDVLRCLAYMHDIEYQTVLYTRELLVTPAWKDPQFRASLTTEERSARAGLANRQVTIR